MGLSENERLEREAKKQWEVAQERERVVRNTTEKDSLKLSVPDMADGLADGGGSSGGVGRMVLVGLFVLFLVAAVASVVVFGFILVSGVVGVVDDVGEVAESVDVGDVRSYVTVPVGESAMFGGWEVSVLSSVSDGGGVVAADPPVGMRFVLVGVEFVLQEPGGYRKSADTPEFAFKLVGSDDLMYSGGCYLESKAGGVPDVFVSGEFYPGGVASGFLCYEVPVGVVGPWLLVTVPGFEGDDVPVLVFEVPEGVVRDAVGVVEVPRVRERNRPAGSLRNPLPVGVIGTYEGGVGAESWEVEVLDVWVEESGVEGRVTVWATLEVGNAAGELVRWGPGDRFVSVGSSGEVRVFGGLGFYDLCGPRSGSSGLLDVGDRVFRSGESVVGDVCWDVLVSDVEGLVMRLGWGAGDDGSVFWDLGL